MNIRKSEEKDIPAIMEIFVHARSYMQSHGNPTQWEEGYPSETIVKKDITNGNSYVCVEGGEVVGTFALIKSIICVLIHTKITNPCRRQSKNTDLNIVV